MVIMSGKLSKTHILIELKLNEVCKRKYVMAISPDNGARITEQKIE